jgi:hypothetical protein
MSLGGRDETARVHHASRRCGDHLAARGTSAKAGKVWRVGFIAGGSRPASIEGSAYSGFLQGMRDLDYVVGKNFEMEWRFAEGRYELFPDLAAELVRLKVDVIV